MTKREAKRRTIKMWKWLAEHPSCDKSAFFLHHPEERVLKRSNPLSCAIESDHPYSDCWLCEYFVHLKRDRGSSLGECDGCPLNEGAFQGCMYYNSPYRAWKYGETKEQRTEAANLLIKKVRAWKC